MNAWYPRVTAHSLAIAVSVLTYVLTTRVEHERRPPSIAIAWVLGLIALPYLVLPAYLMFGRRKLPRRTLQPSTRRAHSQHWAEDLIESFGLPAAAASDVRFHQNGEQASAALFSLLASAQVRIDLCTYILGNDDFGRRTIEAMLECVRRGVRVRLLIDGVGALTLPRAWFHRLNDGGVETAVFSPLFARKTQGPRNLRNHRKWTIADGGRLWAGGRNLADEYFVGAAGKPAWADLSFEVTGPTAVSAAQQFEVDWAAAGGKPAQPIDVSYDTHAGSRTQFLPSGPDQAEDTMHALLIDACFQATRRVLAVTPYFVPDAGLATAMRLAVRRGVTIDLCIPAKSNHLLADFVRNRALRALCSAGLRFIYCPS